MYSTPTLVRKYLQYYYKAANGKGHGVHSPFVYNFITKVLNNNQQDSFSNTIEAYRDTLLANNTFVEVWDKGAGSRKLANNKRKISAIAKAALKPKKYSRLLGSIVSHFKPSLVVELGTSLGITTSYLAAANQEGKVITMEGAPNVANEARKTFAQLGLQNIELLEGDFDEILPPFMNNSSPIGLAYIDGNHKLEPTIRYFNYLKEKSNEDAVFIFDDIHWSEEMETAWAEIKKDPAVTLTIDLFFIGLVFFRKAQQEKEHFIIRY